MKTVQDRQADRAALAQLHPVRAFPSPDLVDASAGLFPGRRHQVSAAPLPVLVESDLWYTNDPRVYSVGDLTKIPEGPGFFVRVGPGVVELRARDLAKQERTLNRLADRRPFPRNEGATRRIAFWSAKSRRNMTRKLAALDYTPLLDTVQPMVLTTLTYPGDWQAVAPDWRTTKDHLERLRKRYYKRWGSAPVAVWKLEFQRRGAPHFHLLHSLPKGCQGVTEFRSWLSLVWADIVGAVGDDFDRHLLAGVAVDTSSASRMRDVKRLCVYFTKHSLKSSGSKEYQHVVPEAWIEGAGRFWGVWGLQEAIASVYLHPKDFICLRRLLRRHAAANGRRLFQGGRLAGGYSLANSGPDFASQLARALALS